MAKKPSPANVKKEMNNDSKKRNTLSKQRKNIMYEIELSEADLIRIVACLRTIANMTASEVQKDIITTIADDLVTQKDNQDERQFVAWMQEKASYGNGR
jgi:hypothetical protein